MSSLRSLKLALNEITSEQSLEKLKNAILHSQLKELDLNSNNIGNNGIKQVASALGSISTLEKLNLSNCNFTAKGALPLFQILAKNSRLKELILDKNFLDGKRLRVLRDFIGNNNGLHYLSMNHCRLGEEGAYFISQGLTKNRKLRTLLLSNNNIFDEGLIRLGQTIGMSSLGLEHLDVSNNTLTDEGVIDFAKNLAENRALITLNLKQN